MKNVFNTTLLFCLKMFYVILFLAQMNNEVLLDAKAKLWTACKQGDNDLLSSVIDNLLAKIKECEEEQSKKDIIDSCATSNNTLVNTDDVAKLVNDVNEDGNTVLHLAALGGHYEQVWCVIFIYY